MLTFRELYHNAPHELKLIIWKQWGAKQNPLHHFEGNTLKHILIVCKRSEFASTMNIALAALFHDLGKMDTFALDGEGLPTAHGHEKESSKYVHQFWGFIVDMGGNPFAVDFIVSNHMKVKEHVWIEMSSKKKNAITDSPYFLELAEFSTYDKGGRYENKYSVKRVPLAFNGKTKRKLTSDDKKNAEEIYKWVNLNIK